MEAELGSHRVLQQTQGRNCLPYHHTHLHFLRHPERRVRGKWYLAPDPFGFSVRELKMHQLHVTGGEK